MRNKIATYALAGALGLTGVAGATLVAPALSYAATGDSAALDSRVTALKEALTGLVSDGTITQAQADQVASTLAGKDPLGGHGRGHRRGGAHLEALEGLGITREEVRAAAEAGKSLATLAKEQGVSEAELVDALVADQKAHLAEKVTAGRLTQAEADARAAQVEAAVTERLDDPIRHGRGHHGHRGGPAGAHETPSETPSQAPSVTPSATLSGNA